MYLMLLNRKEIDAIMKHPDLAPKDVVDIQIEMFGKLDDLITDGKESL